MVNLPEATKVPCNECPWRREAAPGWLGPLDAHEWLETVHSDIAIACHKTIPEGGYHDDDVWENSTMRQCAGAAQFRRNVFKSPRDPSVAVARERDDTEIFGTNTEFKEHHG